MSNYGDSKTLLLSLNKRRFGKVGRLASEDVVLHLVASKCMPILLYLHTH